MFFKKFLLNKFFFIYKICNYKNSLFKNKINIIFYNKIGRMFLFKNNYHLNFTYNTTNNFHHKYILKIYHMKKYILEKNM